MIRARLIPPVLSPEISLETYRAIQEQARTKLAKERAQSRQKSLRHASTMRARSHRRGYDEGMSAARNECVALLESLRGAYESALGVATQDTHLLAQTLAERIVDKTLMEKPEALLSWIERSIAILQRSRSLHLRYHPRYERMIEHIATRLPNGMTTYRDESLSNADFSLQGDTGGVEFSWKRALEELPLSSDAEVAS